MADNTTLNTGTGGDVIATDDISGVKYQRVKVNYGTDGFATDVDYATPLPIDATARSSATGTITTSTSTVTLTGAHGGAATIFISGTYAGVTFTPEISPDGTTWFTAVAFPLTATTGSISTSVSPGTNATAAYAVPLHGATQFRVRATAYTSGTANVVITANGYTPVPSRSVVDLNGAATQSVTLPAFTSAQATTLDTSTARVSSSNGTSSTAPALARNLLASFNVTAVSGTSPSMTIRIQWSPDAGTNWFDIDTTNAQTAAITATGWYHLRLGPDFTTAANSALKDILPATFRYAWTLTGTSPSFTFQTYRNYGA